MAYQSLQQEEIDLDRGLSLQFPPAYVADEAQGPLINQIRKEPASEKRHVGEGRFNRSLFVVASVIACLCSVANIALIGTWHHLSTPEKDSALSSEYRQLEVANSYVKLDTAVYDMPRVSPKPITNFPLVIAHINAREPRAVYLDNPSWMSKLGLIYPEEYKVALTAHQSTIMQFRVLDYGMERCSVVLALPSKTSSTVTRSHDLHVNVWKVRATSRVDPRYISWSTRPARENLLGTLNINSNRTMYETSQFYCTSGSLHSFEMSCSNSPDCHLEFQQDVKQPRLAFYVRQAPSI